MTYQLWCHSDIDQVKLRVHGNGFVQAELADGSKLHIWTSDCPRQNPQTLIHNHDHTFESHVLLGAIKTTEYHANFHPYLEHTHQGSWMDRYQAVVRQEKDTELVKQQPIVITKDRHYFLTPGSYYTLPSRETLFHQVIPESSDLVVTHVQRIGVKSDFQPSVLAEPGQQPDNAFNRYAHHERAMVIYRQALQALDRHQNVVLQFTGSWMDVSSS